MMPAIRYLSFLVPLLSMLVVFVLDVSPGHAGSLRGEVAYRYPCSFEGERISVTTDYRRDSVSVGLEVYDKNRPPRIVFSERKSREQPSEIVLFEYFSACALANKVMAENKSGRPVNTGDDAFRKMIFAADCDALYRMKREGISFGSRGFSYLQKIFQYERARDNYFGVRFPDRFEHIKQDCRVY